jgi:hypothetical protein
MTRFLPTTRWAAGLLTAIVAAVMMSPGGAASARFLAQAEVATPRLNLTLEQRHVIKELIKDMKITPAATPPHSEVGEAVPQDANLQPMPGEIARKVPQIKAHRFMYTADSILIVDPKDNKVAEVIDLKDR